MSTISNEQTTTLLSINEAARILKVAEKTLRRWEERGTLVPIRTNGGHRRYTYQALQEFKKNRKTLQASPIEAPISIPVAPIRENNLNLPTVPTMTRVVSAPVLPEAFEVKPPHQAVFTRPTLPSFSLPKFSAFPQLIPARSFATLTLVILMMVASGVITSSGNTLDLNLLKNTQIGASIPKLRLPGFFTALSKKPVKENVKTAQTFSASKVLGSTSLEYIRFTLNVDANFKENVLIGKDATVSGTLNVASGTILTDSTTAQIFPDTATNLSIGGSSTTLNLGATTGTTTINNATTNIAGILNLTGNQITSVGDITIDPGGGGVKIGTLTPGNVDLASDDLFVSGDLEVDGTAFLPTIAMSGDTITDFSGTGLTVSGGSLQATLGTSIATSEIDDSAVTTAKLNDGSVTTAKLGDSSVTSAKISNDTITEEDLKISNTGTNAYVLSYNSSTGGFTWTDPGALPTAWTDNGTLVTLSTTTDNVSIGGSTDLAKLAVDGDTDEIQLLVQGSSSQTANLFVIENSSGTDLFRINTSGQIVSGSALTTLTTSTGALDADSIGLISSDGTGSTSVGSGLETDSDRLGLLQGCSDGQILKWNDTTSVWACSADSGGAGSAGVINVENNDTAVGTNVDTLDFGTDFSITASPSNEANISVADDSLNFSEFSDSLTLDAATTITNSLAGNLTIDLTSTGDFVIADAGTTFFTFSDSGALTQAGSGAVTFSGATSLTSTLDVTGITTLTANLNANGGLDIDDAFVVADGGVLTTSQTANFDGAADFDGDVLISDTNIAFDGASTTFTMTGALTLTPGGTGDLILSTDSDTVLSLDSTTANADTFNLNSNNTGAATFTGTLTIADLSADRTWTLPDATGTVCLTSGNCAGVGGTGDVIGPGSSTDNAIARFDGTTGKLIQNSGITISDSNAITGITDIDVALTDGLSASFAGDGSPTADILSVSGGTSATSGVDALQLTFGTSNASGNVIDITPSFAGGATDALTYTVIDIDAFSPTNAAGTDTVNALAIGNLTDPGATITSNALSIGSGFDNDITFEKGSSTDVILRVTAASGGDRVLTIPALSANVDLCHSGGNCAGSGSGVTQSGTNASGQIAYFTSSNNITSSASWVFSDAATTGTTLALTNTALTTGELFDLTSTHSPTDGSTNEAIDINITHANTTLADNFRGIDLDISDATALGNTIYNIDSTLSLTGNAAKTGIGASSSVTSSSTTGDTIIALDASTTVTGILGGATTRNVYGLRSQPSAGAESTAGTTNVYGAYFNATGDVGAGGTINTYGTYIANGTYDTDGTSTATGLYVESITGADTNYTAIFAGGNVGIGDTTPGATLEVGNGTDTLQVSSTGDITFVDADGGSSITGPAGGALTIASANSTNLALATTTAGDITLTPAAATGLANILTGNLKVGNGTPGVSLNGEDAYVEGTLEVDSAVTFDSTLSVATSATITGTADGTDALTLTAGDILVSNGDVDLSGGDFNVTLDAADGVNIAKGAAPTVDVFTINGSTSATDGVDGLQLTFGVSAASGNVIDITPSYADATAGGTSETYNILDIDAFTATQNASGDTGTINALNIGNLTQTETAGTITATGISLGTGWDNAITIASGDVTLNSASSELRILESAGATFYGIVDVDDLSADRTYTFPDATGTVCLTTGNCSGVAASDFDQVYAASITNTNLTMEIDDATGLTFNMNTTGAFNIQDNGTTYFSFDDDATLDYTGTTDIDTESATTLAANSLTTGNILDLQATEATLNGGFYLRAYDNTAAGAVFTLGEDGNTTITGSEGSTMLTVTAGDAAVSDGSLGITDDDNAASLALTNNTADTVGASAATGIVDLASTSLTTGSLLNLELTEATLTTGHYIKAWDATAGAAVFTVGEDGNTTITGSEGSNMFTLTAGDAVISDGSLLITDDDDAVSFGVTNNTATTIGAGINTAGVIDISSTSLTTGNLLNLETTTSLTTGTILNISSTATGLAETANSGGGLLANFDWNPGSANTTGTGDLVRIRLDANGTLTSGSLLNIVDESTSLFSVSETQIVNALPTSFTAAGDVSFAYDIQFTNQTASYIKSKAPLYLDTGESFESNDLTLRTYNAGSIVVDHGSTSTTSTTGLLDLNALAGNAAVIAINIDLTQNDGATAATDVIGQAINLTANDADGDVFGSVITASATTNAAAGSYEALLKLVNAENTASTVTDAILIDSTSGTDGDIVDAIDVSDANITNALNIGANIILGTTGSIDFTNFDVASTGAITTGAAGQDGQLIIYNDLATDRTITFNPSSSQAADITYTLPPDDGTADNQVLTTDSNGVLAWESVSGAGGISGSGTSGQISFFNGTSTITSETSGFGWDSTNNILSISGTSSTATAGVLDLDFSSATDGFEGMNASLNVTDDAGVDTIIANFLSVDNDATTADDNVYGIYVENSSSSTANLDAGLYIDNADTTQTIVDAIRIASSGGGAITTGIDLDDTDIVTDIELQNGETIDNNVDGTVNIGTTTFQLTGGTTIVSDQTTVALLNATTTTINAFSAATAVNIADAAITGTIDIGGVTADGASTINIATNATSGDTVTIGNSAAATTLALTGGDAWSISTGGVLTLSADGAQTTAIVATDTDYTNFASIGDNDITGTTFDLIGTTATIDFTDFDVDADGLVTFASDGAGDQITITSPAADFQALVVNGTTNDSTQTAGIIDLNIDSSTTGAVLGQYLTATAIDDDAADTLYGNRTDVTIQDDTTASDTFYADYIDITQNDTTPATTYGLAIIGNDAGAAAITAGILIENLQATDIDLTTGLLIRATTADSIATAIDVSDTEITNAINIGANPLITGNVAGTIGDSTTDSWTFITDGTGTGEIVLPDDSISTAEILDNTITTTNIAATLTFADADFLDLASIIHDDSAAQGFRLPQAASLTALGAGEGFLAYDSDDNQVQVFDGTNWTSISGASTTLQQAYVAGATIDVTSGEGALDIDAQSANVDFEIGQGTDTGDFRIWDGTDNWLLVDESADTMAIGAAAGGGLTLDAGTGTINVGNSNNAKTINIGTGTAADTINIATGGTTADTLTFGNTGVATTFNFDSGASTTDPFDITLDSVTTANGFDISMDGLTTGFGFNLNSTSTALSTGRLMSLDWSPGSATTATGDLMRINIGANGTVGNLLNITDATSTLFSVSETAITSALPHSFTAAGDVSVAYDLQFTNQTSSYIKSNAPLYIDTGESFESNNLTLKTYNSGNIIAELGTSGEFGVNTSAPLARFHVADSSSSTASAWIDNTTDIGTNEGVGLVIRLGSDADNPGTGDRFINFMRGNSTIVGKIQGNGSGAVTYNTNGVDFAEYFKKKAGEEVATGDVVTLAGSSDVTRTTSSYDRKMIGVISQAPGFAGGIEGPDKALVGLVGQVPVNMDQNSSPVRKGDPITSSGTAGKAMRAVNAGQIIGLALEDWNPGTAQVEVFLQPTFYDPLLAFNTTGDIAITQVVNGDMTNYQVNDLNGIINRITAFSDAVIANLRAGRITSAEIKTDTLTIGGKTVQELISEAVGNNPAASVSGTVEATLATDDQGNATIAGTLTANGASFSGRLIADDISGLDPVKAKLELLNASVSGLLSDFGSWSENASSSAVITADAVFANEYLNVQGLASITNAQINSNLIVGTNLAIDHNSITALGTNDNTLYLQATNSGKLNLLAGAVELSSEGGLVVNTDATFAKDVMIKGNLTASSLLSDGDVLGLQLASNEATATDSSRLAIKNASNTEVASITASGSATFSKLVIADTTATNSASLNASTGKAVLSANMNQIKIYTNQVTEDSLIYVTPTSSTNNQVLYVSGKHALDSNLIGDEGYFTVAVDTGIPTDVKFNWWIIN